jgi:hypothetical protein
MCCWLDDHRVVWQGVATHRDKLQVHSLDVDDLMLVLL